MDVIVKVTVFGKIYQFYRNAAQHVAHSSPEQIMSDALAAYAGLICRDMASELCQEAEKEPI